MGLEELPVNGPKTEREALESGEWAGPMSWGQESGSYNRERVIKDLEALGVKEEAIKTAKLLDHGADFIKVSIAGHEIRAERHNGNWNYVMLDGYFVQDKEFLERRLINTATLLMRLLKPVGAEHYEKIKDTLEDIYEGGKDMA